MSDQSQGPGWWIASDGKWYPPQQAARLPPPPASPNRHAMNGCLKAALIGLGILFVFGGGCAALLANSADEVSKDQEERQQSIQDDAELVDCGTGEYGWMVATIRVTNDSSERSNYSVDVSFTSPDGSEQYATGSAYITGLAPDQTRTEEATSTEEPPGKFKCVITDVFRFTDE